VKVVFLGSGPFAIPVLERLHAAGKDAQLVRVVSRPDRPARRGRALTPTPVRARAQELDVRCDVPETANDPSYLEELAVLAADLFIVADYGEMLRKRLRDLPRLGVFNLHASILPRYRGAAPVAHALLQGATETGVTLFRIVKELDAGPVVDIATTPVAPLETTGELEGRLALLAADLLGRNLPAFQSGLFRETPQDDTKATLAPKLEKGSGLISWESPAADVANRVRAFNPWPGAYSFLGGERTIFLRARAVPSSEKDLKPGAVEAVEKDSFRVRCGAGSVEVLELQREGKAPLPAASYLRGKALRCGDVWISSPELGGPEIRASRGEGTPNLGGSGP